MPTMIRTAKTPTNTTQVLRLMNAIGPPFAGKSDDLLMVSGLADIRIPLNKDLAVVTVIFRYL